MIESSPSRLEILSQLTPGQRALMLRRLQTNAAGSLEISKRADVSSPPRASFSQERIWFLEQLDPANAVYNVPLAFTLSGPLGVRALSDALESVVRRHEVLRTSLKTEDGIVVQEIHTPPPLDLAIIDLAALSPADFETALRTVSEQEWTRPLTLDSEVQLRTLLVRQSPGESVLLLTLHHAVCDGWSVGVLLAELQRCYAAVLAGTLASLPELRLQYGDYAVWQRKQLEGGELKGELEYWRGQLAGLSELELPTDRTRGVVQSGRAGSEVCEVCAEAVEGLEGMGRRQGATLFMVLLAAFDALLARYSGQDEIVVGTPVANRQRREWEGLIGLFVNTLVLRVDSGGNPRFRELVERVKEAALGAYAHQEVPFEKLVEQLRPERDLSRNPLFQVMFAHQDAPLEELRLGPVVLRPKTVEGVRGGAKFDLLVFADRTPEGLRVKFEYNSELWEEATMRRMAGHWTRLLEQVSAGGELRVWELELMGREERQQILQGWNRTELEWDGAATLIDLFERQVEAQGERVAVEREGRSWSYRELNEYSTRVSWGLRRRGVGAEVKVAVCVERDLEMVALLLGIWKAGGAYVPLDSEYPRQRLEYMLRDAGIQAVVVGRGLRERVPETGAVLVDVEELWEEAGGEVERRATAQNLAYVLYTSGSTGRPKGVGIEHRSAVALMYWVRAALAAQELDGMLASTSLNFDLSVFELMGPLAWGGRVVVARNALELGERGGEWNVRTVNTVPSSVRELAQAGRLPGSVEAVLVAGEPLRRELVDRVYELGHVRRVLNLYGPTEATTYSTWSEVGRQGAVTIGRGLANTQVYILDRHLRPVPIGITGELYLGGAGLARGYIGKPEWTAEKFVPDEFSGRGGARLYRTGDLGRWGADGEIQYQGRRDQQIKLRGYRIELGEVERGLEALEGVAEAAAAVQGEGLEQRLVGYVVWNGQPLAWSQLRAALRQRLPEYMLPAVVVEMEALPRTVTGKLDRKRLPGAGQQRPELGNGYVAPANALEAAVVELWRELLKLDRVGVHDHFFELGGHSLLAVQLASRVHRRFGVTLPLRQIFLTPSPAGLATFINSSRPSAPVMNFEVTPDLENRHEPFPLTPVQQAYWIGRSSEFELGNVAIHSYIETEPVDFDVERFERAWQRLIDRHDMLRAVVTESGEQRILAETPRYKIAVEDLRDAPEAEREAAIGRKRAGMSHQVFNPAVWPCFDIRVTRLTDRLSRLHISIDELFCDAWSGRILIEEVGRLYGEPEAELKPLEISFRDYVVGLKGLEQSPEYERARRYWRERIPEMAGAPELPLACDPQKLEAPHFERRTGRLEERRWKALKARAAALGLTPSGVLAAAFCEILHAWSRQSCFTLNLTLFHRLAVHADIRRLVGDFTSLTLLEADWRGGSFQERARKLQERLWADLDHALYSGVEVLRDLGRQQGRSGTVAMPVVFTSTLGQEREMAAGGAEEMERWAGPAVYGTSQTPQVWLDHQVYEREGDLAYNWDVVEGLFPAGMWEEMFAAWEELLQRLSGEEGWSAADQEIAPDWQKRLWEKQNQSGAAHSQGWLGEEVVEQARRGPAAEAVVDGRRRMSRGELVEAAWGLAQRLREAGVGRGELVALGMEKGWEQVVAVLGVELAQAAYVPLDPEWPQERIHDIVRQGGIGVLVRDEAALAWPEGLKQIVVRAGEPRDNGQRWECEREPQELAYVIFTSGSTGKPKGVMIEHGAVLNTIRDINQRMQVGEQDALLGVSALSFDLSVYDVFGVLGAGGRLVFPERGRERHAAHWWELLERERVTMWNSVPALAEMLADEPRTADTSLRLAPADTSLRLAMLSGDWIGLDLPGRMRQVLGEGLEIWSLGGATEGSIWSIGERIEQVETGWKSIPYGRALSGQKVEVRHQDGRRCPVWVSGELYLGGAGVARGYLARADLTAASFVEESGQRWYRTGDWGRYWPDGRIELEGRRDGQVKLRGYRIELGEVEATLAKQEGVKQAAALLAGKGSERRIVAWAASENGVRLDASELRQRLRQHLPDYMVPSAIGVLEQLPLTANGKLDRKALALMEPERGTSPATELAVSNPALAREIAGWIAELLKLPNLEIHTNIVDTGATSVDLLRIVNMLEQKLHYRPKLNQVFDHPSAAGLSRLWEAEVHSGPAPHGITALTDPDERETFKKMRHGLRLFDPAVPRTKLDSAFPDEGLRAAFLARRSHRRFASGPISAAVISRFLSCLAEIKVNGASKFYYPSAGNLYAVQVYVHLKPNAVRGIGGGVYYYDPLGHELVCISKDAVLPSAIHNPILNQPIFASAAFSLFLLVSLDAIEPIYGDAGMELATLEAGYIGQLLSMHAPACGIGLCPIGEIEFEPVRDLFGVDARYRLLHSLLGGSIEEMVINGGREELLI